MTISFSGLASGLDTSSWVSALTQLKQAKVTTLQEKKENIIDSNNALAGIKSFFSTFRSMVEKVTDSKFKIASMDIFSQNIATSSRVEVLTASATADAKEATYNLRVDQLATKTKAESTYRQTTVYNQTTQATYDTYLRSIGVNAGDIEVTVGNVTSRVTIQENDTISTFAQKLRDKGVDAGYNVQTGKFGVNIDKDAINDIGNTNIKTALKLENTNPSFVSGGLEIDNVTTHFADRNTHLSDVGIHTGSFYVDYDGEQYEVQVEEGDKFDDLMSVMEEYGIRTTLENGVFSITNAEITDEGDTNIISALGLSSTISSVTLTSNNLQCHQAGNSILATSENKINDILDTNHQLTDGETVELKLDNGTVETITLTSADTKIGEFVNELNELDGVHAEFTNGVLSLSGAEVTGGTFDAVSAFGLNKHQTVSGEYTLLGSHSLRTYDNGHNATADTKLSDLGYTADQVINIVDSEGNEYTETFVTTANLGNIADTLHDEYGITMTVNEGVLNFINAHNVDGKTYAITSGGLADDWGIRLQSTTVNTIHQESSESLNCISTSTATAENTLEELGFDRTAYVEIYGSDGNLFTTMSFATNTTLGDVMDAIAGIDGFGAENVTLENGVLSITSTDGKYIAGTFADKFDICVVNGIGGTVTTGVSLTSSDAITYSSMQNATSANTLSSLGLNGPTYTLNIKDSDGEVIDNYEISSTAKLSEIFDLLGNYGINATMFDGKVSLVSNSGNYIDGSLADALGVGTVTTTTDTTIGNALTSSAPITYSEIQTAKLSSRVSDFVTDSDNWSFAVHNLVDGTTHNYTINSSTTFDDLKLTLSSDGITMSLNNGSMALTASSGYIYADGNLMSELGVNITDSGSSTEFYSPNTISSSGRVLVNYSGTTAGTLNENTTLADLGFSSDQTFVITGSDGSSTPRTYDTTTYIGTIATDLLNYGITMSIHNGRLSFTNEPVEGISYGITGGTLAEAWDIESTTEIENTYSQESTSELFCSTQVLADGNTTLFRLGIDGNHTELNVYDSSNNYVTTLSFGTSNTLDDVITEINSVDGIGENSASISGGVIDIDSPNGYYVTGSLADALGISVVNSTSGQTTTGVTLTSTAPITYTNTVNASGTNTLGDIGVSGSRIYVNDSTGTCVRTINVSSTTSLNQISEDLEEYGINFSVADGRINISSDDGYYISGPVAENLGISTSLSASSTTIVNNMSSSTPVTYGSTEYAILSDLMSDYVDIGAGLRIETNHFSVTSTSTFEDLQDFMGDNNVTMTMENGVITLTPDDPTLFIHDNHIHGDQGLLNQLGISVTNTPYNTILIAGDQTSDPIVFNNGVPLLDMMLDTRSVSLITEMSSSNPVYCSGNTTASANNTLADIGLTSTSGYRLLIKNSSGQTIADSSRIFTNAETLQSVFDHIDDYGITATMNNGIITLSAPNGNYIDGALATALGFGNTSHVTTGTIGITQTSTTPITYTGVATVTVGQTETTDELIVTGANGGLAQSVTAMTQAQATSNGYTWVTTTAQLTAALQNNQKICLGADIDLSSVPTNQCSLVGTYSNELNGNGHTLSNLTINWSGNGNGVGLIGNLGGTVKNLIIKDFDITSSSSMICAGCIAGNTVNGANIYNVAVIDSSASSRGSAGAIAGFTSTNCTVSYCKVYNSEVSGDNAGGLVGHNSSSISNSAVHNVSVSGQNGAGGIAGSSWSATITSSNAYNATISSVSTYTDVAYNGGLIGNLEGSTSNLSGCNAINVSVSSSNNGSSVNGGLVGMFMGGTVQNCNVSATYIMASQTIKGGSDGESGKAPDSKGTSTGGVANVTGCIDFGNIHSGGTTTTNNHYDTNCTAYTIDGVNIFTGSGTTGTSMSTQVNTANSYILSSSTTLSNLGLNGTKYITIGTSGTSTNTIVTLTASTTIAQFCQKMTNAGVTTAFDSTNGTITVQGGQKYIKSISDELTNILGGLEENPSLTLTSGQVNATTTTKLSSIGVTSTTYVTVINNGTQSVVTLTNSTTLGGMASALSQKGITMTTNNGTVTIAGTDSSYIKGMTATLATKLHIQQGAGYTYATGSNTTYAQTTSNTQHNVSSQLADDYTTFGELGLTGTRYMTIVGNGTSSVITVTQSTTIHDLRVLGAPVFLTNDGVVFKTDSDNKYLLGGLDPDIANCLNLSPANSPTIVSQRYECEIGNAGIGDGTLTVYNSTTGVIGTVNYGHHDTFMNVLDALSDLGIDYDLTDGALNFTSTSGNFISGDSNTTNGFLNTIGITQPSQQKVQDSYSYSPSNVLGTENNATPIDDTTSLGDIGIHGGSLTIHTTSGDETITYSPDNIGTELVHNIGDLIDALDSYGITASCTPGGTFVINQNNNAYITSDTGDLLDNLHININTSYNISDAGDTYNVTDGHQFTANGTTTATLATTFAQLGITSNQYVTVMHNGTQQVFTATSAKTISDFKSFLNTNGFTATLNNGILNISGSEGSYFVNDFNDTLDGIFHFEEKTGSQLYNTETNTSAHNTNSNVLNVTNIAETTTGTQLGTMVGFESGNINIYQNGTLVGGINLAANTTIQNVLDGLNAYDGIQATFRNGSMSLTYSDDYVLTGMPAMFNLGTRTTVLSETTFSTSTSAQLNPTEQVNGTTQLTEGMLSEKTLGDIGVGSGTLTIYNTFNNNVGTIDYDESTIFADLFDGLGSYGINYNIRNGYLSFTNSGENFIGADSNSVNGFLAQIGATTSSDLQIVNNKTMSCDSVISKENIVKLNDNTTFAQLGITESGSLTIHTTAGNRNIFYDGSTEMGNFIDALEEYGITASCTSQGRFRITQSDGFYITDDSLGDNGILAKLNIDVDDSFSVLSSGEIRNTQGTTTLQSNVESYINNDTTFGELGITEAQSVTAVVNGTTVTRTMTENSTIGDFRDWLENNGFTTSIDDGRFTIGCTAGSYFDTDFNDNLDAIFHFTELEGDDLYHQQNSVISMNTTSSVLQASNIDDIGLSSRLGSIVGFEAGNLSVYQNGSLKGNVYLSANSNVQDMLNGLNSLGIGATLNADGTISLDYTDDYTLSGPLGAFNFTAPSITDSETTVSNLSSNKITYSGYVNASTDTEIGQIRLSDNSAYTGPSYNLTVTVDGTDHILAYNSHTQLGKILEDLQEYGIVGYIDDDGKINTKCDREYSFRGPLAEFLLGSGSLSASGSTDIDTNYNGTTVYLQSEATDLVNADDNTRLSELGVTNGSFYIYKNGARETLYVGSDQTLGDFRNLLENKGLQTHYITTETGRQLVVSANDNSYITASERSDSSNVISQLFGTNERDTQYNYSGTASYETTTSVSATEATMLNLFGDDCAGDLIVSFNDEQHVVHIASTDSIGSMLNKFRQIGIVANIDSDGVITLDGGLNSFSIDTENSTSNLLDNLGLVYNSARGGYCMSSDALTETHTITEELALSVANDADIDTKLSTLGISSGSLSIIRNGEKKVVQVDTEETFDQLNSKIQSVLSDVSLSFDDGILTIDSSLDDAVIKIGTTNDTTNLSSICGLLDNEDGTVSSTRRLYKVNGASKLTEAGLFRRGTITAGDFIIGDDTFTIDENTTVNDLVYQINSSDKANATAYWDSVSGNLMITSRITGASLINIEKGSQTDGATLSNFTEIMGYTDTTGRMQTNAQTIGKNAKFSIDGTDFTSTSNTVTSDISRIDGVTINLKNVTAPEDEDVELTISRDSETAANAIGDVIDSYNTLIENLDKELASTGKLSDQSVLKMIRNQIRSLMTSSISTSSVFKNLSAVGISTKNATTGNVSTTTNDVSKLSLDRDKFINAFNSDPASLKTLFVGNDETGDIGIFNNLETILEQALTSASGYFSTQEAAFKKQITNYNEKISKTQSAVDRYQARLESKFQAMDMLISNIKNQYNSFLTN
ncbi:MAG: flagellar filament capping protein FliD [bacterium]|nr:flagellar filament capping protein FliD [bacterium]